MFKDELIKKIEKSESFVIPMWLKRVRPDILNWIKNETSSFTTKSIMENVFIILNGDPPRCLCGNYRIFNTFEKGYRTGCKLGNRCLEVEKNRIEKQKNTLLEKYGVTNASKLESSKQKTINTNLEKYGTNHHSQNSVVKEKTKETKKLRTIEQKLNSKNKTKETNLKTYGVDHHMKLEIQKQKVKLTNVERYNVEFPLQNIDSVTKMKETFLNNNLLDEVNKKRKQTIIEKYKVDAVSKIHLLSNTLEILKNKQNFDSFVNQKTREEVLTELKIHEHTLYLYAKKYNSTELFKRPLTSKFEKQVSEFLNELNLTYTQNDRTVIKPMEIDFYIKEFNLAIECCGLYWHSENSAGRNRNYHFEKFTKCKDLEITLLTIFQDEWENENEKVKNRIKYFLDYKLDKVYARNTQVKEISTNLAKEFIEEFHIQNYTPASIKIGLFYQDELCAVMTFGKSRFNKNNQFELVRYCSNKNIVGGPQKLLSYFKEKYNPENIISYSDNRYFNGAMYKNLNFVENDTHIGYFYTDYHKRFNRLNFQKHKLVEAGNDKNKSEWEIMQELGYDRIWDCGQTTWTLKIDK